MHNINLTHQYKYAMNFKAVLSFSAQKESNNFFLFLSQNSVIINIENITHRNVY